MDSALSSLNREGTNLVQEHTRITEAAHALATAIGRRDEGAIRDTLAPDFVLRSPGGPSVDAEGFLSGIRQIPGEIVFVKLEDVHVELTDGYALVTGVQHAQLILDGATIDDRRPFVDWFLRNEGGTWQIKLALDLPSYP
jgi:hypothetical protein